MFNIGQQTPYRFNEAQHIHTFEGKPLVGSSTAMSVLSKPLQWWAAELAAVECLEAGEKIEGIRQEYEEAVASPDKKTAIDALQKKYPMFRKARFAHFATLKDKAKKGTDLHAELEMFVKNHMLLQESGTIDKTKYDPKIKPFIDWTAKNVKRFRASEAHVYSEKLWIGGILDAIAELSDGKNIIIDFKSSKDAYTNQFLQIALYDLQVEENGTLTPEGVVVNEPIKIDSYAVFPFGAENPAPVFRNDLEKLREGAQSALTLHKIINNGN